MENRNNIYTDGDYLSITKSWHVEDSEWKASQITSILKKNGIQPNLIAEVGCGAGVILQHLSNNLHFKNSRFWGYDISPQAIEMCMNIKSDRISFSDEDPLQENHSLNSKFDLLMAIDVFEHIPKHIDFLEKCKNAAAFKLFHIPLDLHVSSVLRNSFIKNRYTIGHVHYFSEQSAIAVLRDCGYDIIDYTLTPTGIGLFSKHPSLKRALANVPRVIISTISKSFAARLIGGYSLLALTK
jgi:hypothetical protein